MPIQEAVQQADAPQQRGARTKVASDRAFRPSTYVDCCYALYGVEEMRSARQRFPILIHNYDVHAPSWCDPFDVGVRADNAWFPLEQHCAGEHFPFSTGPEAHTSPDGGTTQALRCAFAARTLQERLEGAKAALRAGGPTATDARLLMTECMPVQSQVARFKALAAAADVAVAAANEEAAGPSARAAAAQSVRRRLSDTPTVLEPSTGAQLLPRTDLQDLPPARRAAIRTVLAMLRCYHQCADELHEQFRMVCHHIEWLEDIDENSVCGDNVLRMDVLWTHLHSSRTTQEAHATRRSLIHESIGASGDDCGMSVLMLVPYSLYFAAFSAPSEPGGGPKGALVRKALLAIKRADPCGWVPRLLAGLELCDPTRTPSVILGSKQEAMACCRLLGHAWLATSVNIKNNSSRDAVDFRKGVPALKALLLVFGLETPELRGRAKELRLAAATFSRAGAFDNNSVLAMHETVSACPDEGHPAEAVDKNLEALWAHCLLLTATANMSHNLPPLHGQNFRHWEGSDAGLIAVNVVPGMPPPGHEVMENTPATEASLVVLLEERALTMFGRALRLLGVLQGCVTEHDARWCQLRRCAVALEMLQPSRLRWLWQCNKPGLAAQMLDECLGVNEAAERPSLGNGRDVVAGIARLRAFLAKEIAAQSSSAQSAAAATTAVAPAAGDSGLVVAARAQQCVGEPGTSHADGAGTSNSSLPEVEPSAVGTSNSAAAETSSTDSCQADRRRSRLSKPCAQCGAAPSKPKRCGGCSELVYCNVECQRVHWLERHKAECTRRLIKL